MHTAILVLVEVLIILAVSRLMGTGFRWLRQPLVIGEIVAGIMLGPSLLGLVLPDVANWLFPAHAVPFLEVLSEVGLIFFMFLIGLELNPRYLKGQLEVAILTSQVSILVPFCLGLGLALVLYPLVSTADVSFTAFALFLGAAMSITAFPVLARIITENNLQNTRLGTLALTCAAVDDITAWCLLALAIAVTRTNSMIGAIPTILMAIAYVTLMVTLGRRFLYRLSIYYNRLGKLNQLLLACIYMGVLASALITEWIGIHLIFGAFLLGAVMPKNANLARELAEKTEDFVLIFLLPVFFAYSGLRTQIGLLNTPSLWGLCGLVLLVAISGKYIGTYGAARVCRLPHREASALGILMNTRGLTELILLNIGLSLGVISPLLFTMLVIMALVTTFMTSPLLEWIYPKQEIRLTKSEGQDPMPIGDRPSSIYRILVPIANPTSQGGLVNLAVQLAFPQSLTSSLAVHRAAVYPLSLIPIVEDYAFASTPVEVNRQISLGKGRLDQLVDQLQPPEVRQAVHPIIRVSSDVARETTAIAAAEKIDLVLLGWHRPTFSTNRLGGRVGQILTMAQTDVAVFVDRQPLKLDTILVPYASSLHDDLGLELAFRLLLHHPNCNLTVLRICLPPNPPPSLSYEFRTAMDTLPLGVRDRIHIPVVESDDPLKTVVDASATVDLTIAGASREWGLERQTLGYYADELATRCRSSLLITRKYSRVTSHLSSALVDLE